jgi:hypothetical protein
MDKSQDPHRNNAKKVDKRRISFSDDFHATAINPHSYSPMRRVSVSPNEKEREPENQKLQNINSQQSTQIMIKSNVDLLSKVPSMYIGGFESILSKVSDTYKIQDILPKNSSANIIKSEYSITSSNPSNLDPTLLRHPTDKTTDSRRKSIIERKPSLVTVDPLLSSMSSGHRKNSLLGKNVVTDRGTFGLIMADDDFTEIKKDTFIKSKNEIEGSKLIQKLQSFENRSSAKIIPVESDNESIKSFGSHNSEDEQPDVNHSVMASFTGELLKRKPTFLGSAINIIPEASVHLDSNKLGIPLTDNFKRRGSFASSLFNVPAPTEEIKPPQSTKAKLKMRLQPQESQPIINQGNNNRLLALEVEHAAPLPKIKQSRKKDSIKLGDKTTSGTIENWKKLRNESRGFQYGEAVDSEKSKFVGLSEVASVVYDLKSLGMDPNIIVNLSH